MIPSDRIRHLADAAHYARMSNGTSVPSNWALTSTGSNYGVTWSPQAASAGSVSYGSNANDVGNANAGGASSLVSRADHVHKGVRTITAAGSNGLFGDVNLAAGANMAITTSGQTITLASTAPGGGASTTTVVIPVIINGAGSVIATGVAADLTLPFACTVTGWRALADQSGSISVGVWKDTYANYPPTSGDLMLTASITTADKNEATGLSHSISAGDTLRFNVTSATTITRVLISLTATRSL